MEKRSTQKRIDPKTAARDTARRVIAGNIEQRQWDKDRREDHLDWARRRAAAQN